MNKVVIREFKKEYKWIKGILYGLFVLIGLEFLNFSEMGVGDPIKFAPFAFYGFAFLSLFAYFINRVKDDYELLLLGLINIIIGTFVLTNIYYPNSGFILADGVLAYSIANVLNSGFSCIKLLKEKNIAFFMRAAITVMLLFLGVIVVSALYGKVMYGTLILGYYFVAFGLLHLLEVFAEVVLKDKDLQKKILNFVAPQEEEEDEKTEKKVVKNRTIKKIKRK